MYHIPYARSDMTKSRVNEIVAWLGVDELLEELRKLPPSQQFDLLLLFLVEFAGGLNLAECRMMEMLSEQSAYSFKAHGIAVQKIKERLKVLYNGYSLENAQT